VIVKFGTLVAEGRKKLQEGRVFLKKILTEGFRTDNKVAVPHSENYGQKGNLQEVEAYYQRGDISYQWYQQIIRTKD